MSTIEEVKKRKVETVRVFKYDGSLQCGMGTVISLDDMQKQLGAIKVFSADKENDGMIRTMVCGAPTGQANVYEIPKTETKRATKLGFQVWNFN